MNRLSCIVAFIIICSYTAFAQTGVNHWETVVYDSSVWKYWPGTSDPGSSWALSTFDDGAVIVKTTENYDDNGPVEDHVTYTVIQEGDAWRIDSIDFEDDRTDTSTNA